MSATDRLLDRLHGVRKTGTNKWIACCPGHDDRSPSLSIREIEDRVLIHCFAGCDALQIVAAVGLKLSDLFDKPLDDHIKPTKSRISANDRLALIDHEAIIVCLTARQIAAGEFLKAEDHERLLLAAHRIGEARDLV